MPSVAAAHGRFRPRSITQDPHDDSTFWVVDAGARRENAGRLWRLHLEGETVSMTVITTGLNRAHGSDIGPDGKLYVSQIGSILRFDTRASDVAASREVVLADLPSMLPSGERIRFHPLPAFVFAPNGDLIVNMGSSTDHCQESLDGPEPAARCHDEADHTAAVWRFAYDSNTTTYSAPRYIAHGLRNSVALASHASGTLLQGENAVDFPEDGRPSEELNVLREGQHYGWPYCYDMHGRDERWAHATFACDATNPTYAPPLMLLPAHGAPLGMVYYEGPLTALQHRLLISLHGYRPLGHRVIALRVNAEGLPNPSEAAEDIIAGWDASDTHPKGTPVAMTVARDGSLWLVEDNNGTVLRLSRDAWPASRSSAASDPSAHQLVADAAFTTLHHDVLQPRCGHCHALMNEDASHTLTSLRREGWLRADEDGPLLWARTRPEAERRMPLDGMLTEAETAAIRTWVRSTNFPGRETSDSSRAVQ
jgi:glucose/arabinose dehydrogenase